MASTMPMRALAAIALFYAAGPGCGGAATEPKPQGPTQQDKVENADKLLEQAIQAEQAGEPNVAEKKYRRALRLRPNHFETNQHLSQFLVSQGHADEAIEIGKDYLHHNPGDPRGYHMLAEAALEAGDYRQARSTLNELLTIDNEDAAAYEERSRAALMAGDVEQGVADARKAVRLDMDNADFLVSLGSALERAGKLDEAALNLRSALQLEDTNARAYLILGIVMREQYEPKLALSNHLKAARYAPDSSRAHFELGITQNMVGDNIAAEQSLKRAVELDPNNAQNWYAYGDIERVLKKYDEAVPAYRKALELNPKHPKAANKLGLALFYTGQLGKAEVVLTEAIRMNASDPYPYFNLGMVYEKQEKFSLALSAFEKFTQLAPPEDGDQKVARQKIRELKRKIRRHRR